MALDKYLRLRGVPANWPLVGGKWGHRLELLDEPGGPEMIWARCDKLASKAADLADWLHHMIGESRALVPVFEFIIEWFFSGADNAPGFVACSHQHPRSKGRLEKHGWRVSDSIPGPDEIKWDAVGVAVEFEGLCLPPLPLKELGFPLCDREGNDRTCLPSVALERNRSLCHGEYWERVGHEYLVMFAERSGDAAIVEAGQIPAMRRCFDEATKSLLCPHISLAKFLDGDGVTDLWIDLRPDGEAGFALTPGPVVNSVSGEQGTSFA